MGLNILRNMNRQTRRLEESTGKLASGLRVSSAAADAAGLSISEKMRARIRGLRMAARNAQDAQSYLQTEGTLQEVHRYDPPHAGTRRAVS